MSKSSKSTKKPGTKHELPQPARASNGLLVWVFLGLCLLLAGGGTWAILEFVVWAKIPSTLAGKWVVIGGEQDGATFDFYRNGTMVGYVNMGGNPGIINAHVTVEEDTLFITSQNQRNGREETKRHIIKTLSARELVLEDEQKNTHRMERADPRGGR